MRADQPPNLIKLQAFQRIKADGAMSRMRRIERSAEDADAKPGKGRS
jgi:hypothetical protein